MFILSKVFIIFLFQKVGFIFQIKSTDETLKNKIDLNDSSFIYKRTRCQTVQIGFLSKDGTEINRSTYVDFVTNGYSHSKLFSFHHMFFFFISFKIEAPVALLDH